MSTFRVSFTVKSSKLSTVIQVLSHEVTGLRIEQEEGMVADTMPKPPRKGRFKKESKTSALILSTFAGREFTNTDAGAALVKGGWAASSWSPLRSKLIRAGQVRHLGKDLYTVVGDQK